MPRGWPLTAADRAGGDAATTNLASPASALAVGAHPDDIEFGAGATLAKWAAAGCTVHHLVCTDGSKGTWDPAADLAALVTVRQEEQRAAAALVRDDGIRDIGLAEDPARPSLTFLGQVDGTLTPTPDLVGEVARTIRTLRPEVVLGHDPWKRYRLHPDHRNAGTLLCDAIVAARDPHFFPEHGLAPHRPRVLLLFEADVPNHAEDASGWADRKLAALLAHTSQFETTMGGVDEHALESFRVRIRSELSALGTPFGFGAAELFARIDDL